MTRRVKSSRDNEGLVCDAVVRVLEERTGQQRSNIEHPEGAGVPGGVDLLFRLGSDQYALEHTRIEPFPNQIQHDAQFSQFIGPVMDQLEHDMPQPGVYDLIFPLDTRFNAGAEQLEALRTALLHWVRDTAQDLQAIYPRRLSREECPHGVRDTHTGRPEGFPFDVTLARSVHWAESGVHDGVLRPVRIAPADVEALRRERIQTAIDKKRPKLAHRKSEGARAVLVMENNDMILSNHALVGEHFAVLLPEQPCWLDELFFMYTTTSTWTLHRWSWEDAWWEDGYIDFDPGCLHDVCAN